MEYDDVGRAEIVCIMIPRFRKTIHILIVLVIAITPVMNCHAGLNVQESIHAGNVPHAYQSHDMTAQHDIGPVNHDPFSSSPHDSHHAGQCQSCSHCYMMVSITGAHVTSLVHERLLNLPVHSVSIFIPVDIKPPIHSA